MPTRRNATPAIHPQLLSCRNWLLRRVKVPHYITGAKRTGTLDSRGDLKRLATFEDACAKLSLGGYDGLGLAINGGIQFIDLDRCYDEQGKVKPLYQLIVKKAKALGAFAERSISGYGLHIFGRGPTLKLYKVKDPASGQGIEQYTEKRYAAMGTPVWPGSPDLPDLTPLEPLVASIAATLKPSLRLVTPGAAPSTLVPVSWKVDIREARKLLRKIPPDATYDDWVQAGQAIHAASNGDVSGLKLWDGWSQGGEKYKEGECERKWQGFHTGGGIKFGTLVHLAEEYEKAGAPEDDVDEGFYEDPNDEFSGTHLLKEADEPINWLVENLIPPGLTLLAAPPKTGKSYFMLQAAVAIATGVPFLDMATRKSRVLYLNLEEWKAVIKPRFTAILKHMHLKSCDDLVFRVKMPEGMAPMDYIQRRLDEGFDVVIIDIFARVRNEAEEDSKINAYARDYRAMEAWANLAMANPGKSIVVVHHGNKGKHEAWQDKISGSNGVAGATHTNMMMAKLSEQGLDDEARERAKSYRKLNYVGKQVEDRELMLKQQDGVWIMSEETENDVRTSYKQTQVLMILRASPKGTWTPGMTLIKLLEDDEKPSRTRINAWYVILRRMVVKGLIVSNNPEGYMLAPSRG